MRNLLATAVALAPLMAATGALADVTISTTRTTPIVTSTIGANGGADNVIMASGGAVNVGSGVAITVNSNNNLTFNSGGGVNMANAADGATAVLVTGGVTSNLISSGDIAIIDSLTDPADTDSDGDLDGPFATGTGRYGIRMTGPGAVTGNVRLNSFSRISVEGNNSYGVSIESDLVGNLINQGTIQVIGTNNRGLAVTGDITGRAYVGGTITAVGENASAATFDGDISGQLSIQGSLTATGYRYTSRPAAATVAKLDADDLLQGGPALLIAGNAAAGVVLDRPPTESNANSTDDDNDGVNDTEESTSRIISYGEAPGVQVGSTTRDITLAVNGTGDSAFGFINRGDITGAGVYDDVDAHGITFGGTGQAVVIAGGVRNEGNISAISVNGDASAVTFAAGSQTPTFVNTGSLTVQGTSENAIAIDAVRVEAGSNLTSFSNSGFMAVTGYDGGATATAIVDLSGTLTSITNTRSIQVGLLPNADGDDITGSAVAIDVRANTTGVTVLQTGTPRPITDAEPDADGDGVPNLYEPLMVGDILMGSGADTVSFQNGAYAGDISFGAGQDSLLIGGGALVVAGVTDADGLLDINIANGTLESRNEATANISNMNIGADGQLIVTLDPAASAVYGFNVSGTATLADGAGLGVRFNSLLDGPQRFVIIDAGTLDAGVIDDAAVDANSPFLFVVDAAADEALGQVYVDARRRTADEAGLSAVEGAGFDAFYAALERDEDVLAAFLAQNGRAGFIDLYEQTLPDHSGGPLLSLASGVDAVTRALTGRNATAAPGETSAWLQEINFYADKDRTDTYGFRSEGFGVAGGVERGTGIGALGLSVAFTSSDLEDPEAEAEEVLSANLLELGLYWRAQGQYWTTWARAAAGYASFEATRQIVGAGLNLSNESDWHGYTLAAAAGASYERTFGRFGVRPEIYAEYFSLSEDARTESGAGDAFDLAIDSREGHMFSAVAAVNLSLNMGERSWLKPELRVGWRQNISVDPGETIARYVSGGPSFALSPDSIEGGGPLVGLRLNIGNDLGMLTISADAEMIEDYVRAMLFLRASFRF